VRTYLLVHAEPGRAGEATRAIASDPCVRWADTVAGAYDVIAEVDVDGTCQLSELIARWRGRSGIARLIACPAASHQSMWDEALAAPMANV
jgi:hypothetical protein